jgi:hypothetical protein
MGQLCNKCARPDHFGKMCKTTKAKAQTKVHEVHQQNFETEDPFTELVIDSVEKEKSKPWIVPITVNNVIIPMKLDTGSVDVNILSRKDFVNLKNKPVLHGSKVKLTAFNGGDIPVTGKAILTMRVNGLNYKTQFVVCADEVVPILGRKSCEDCGLIKRVFAVSQTPQEYANFFEEYADTFTGLGCLPGKVSIETRDDIKPVVEPCRKVPFGLNDRLKQELDRMESMNVIVKVNKPTEWVNSMVIVHKPNGQLRICLDPRNLNKAIKREHYKLPTREEISANFGGSKYFSKLDCRSGYWMLQLDDDSSELCTFNTCFGRYRYLRLPFGISSASEIFQRKMAELFENIDGVEVSQDDIAVHADTKSKHDSRLHLVFKVAREHGLKFNLEKCLLGVNEITFIGDRYTDEGLKIDHRKVEAITKLSRLVNRTEIQSFLGMVNYLARFIPDLSSRSAPLRSLLDKNIQWKWEHEQEKSWIDLKTMISSQPVLQYYDVTKPVKISTDASQKRLGSVLLQSDSLDDENWLPVAYASRAMTECEQRYAQIEKEALAIAFACERFHQYVYGLRFQVQTDHIHKPLIPIFGKALNDCPARLQRLRLRLQRYDFELKFNPGKLMFTADALSRNYLSETGDGDLESQVKIPVTDRKMEEIKLETDQDEVMCELRRVIVKGWQNVQVNCTLIGTSEINCQLSIALL